MKKLKFIFSAVIFVSLTISAIIFFTDTHENSEASPLPLNLTIVETPAQTEPGWPVAIPDPLASRVALPESPNLALRKPVSADTSVHNFIASNAADGSLNSYWESSRLPAAFTIDLENIYKLETVAVALNPLWESRSQMFEILTSECGENFYAAAESAVHFFTPSTANTVRIDFEKTNARFVRLVFTVNTAAYTNGAQAAEIKIF